MVEAVDWWFMPVPFISMHVQALGSFSVGPLGQLPRLDSDDEFVASWLSPHAKVKHTKSYWSLWPQSVAISFKRACGLRLTF